MRRLSVLTPETTVAQLVRMVKAGDRSAFDALVRRFQRAVHAVAFAVVSDREAALDVLQESLIAAYRQLHTLEDPDRFGPWVCGIARNKAKMAIRERHSRDLREVHMPDVEPTSVQPRLSGGVERFREALAALTEVQADIVTLFYMEGYSIRECAGVLEVPEGTVKRRLHDARQKLRREMIDMVKQELTECALPEDYRVVIDWSTQTHTTAPALTWFRDRWVLIVEDGEPWEPYDGPFWFLLSESTDGRDWTEPRRLQIGPQWQSSPKICVLGDELVLHTHHHNYGLIVHRSVDLVHWTECPSIHVYEVGRSDVFADGSGLFVTYPIWRPQDVGDAVEVIRSSDHGASWTWLNQPCPSDRSGITDAAGYRVGGRLYSAWRGHHYPLGTGSPNDVHVSWSDDGSGTWSEPVPVKPLCTERGSFRLQFLNMPNSSLALVQDVRDDYAAGEGEIWLAVSKDGGRSWNEKAIYRSGRLRDPAIAAAPDGSILLAGSCRSGDEARPWIVHSRIGG